LERRFSYAATQTRCQAHRTQDFTPQSRTFSPDRTPDVSTQVELRPGFHIRRKEKST
jgi:hypothetical protein